MYIQDFSFGNFKSFRDINSLSLMATKSNAAFSDIDENNLFNVSNENDVRLMRSKAIYGANSSGKSNIIKALTVFINIVKNSQINRNVLFDIDKFRFNDESIESTSYFQIIFWDGSTRYRYGFEADSDMIYSEWLFHKPGKREESLFIREQGKEIEVNKNSFTEGDLLLNLFDIDKGSNDLFRDNSLVLTTLSTFGIAKISANVSRCISSINVISGLGDGQLLNNAEKKLEDISIKEYILNLLKFGDIGIDQIDYISFDDEEDNLSNKKNNKRSNNKYVYSVRKKYNKEGIADGVGVISFEEESEGTKKLFEIAPYIYEAFKNNTPLVIDEFDARFHPVLTRAIIKLFNNKNNSNNPQFVFTTHDTNLLDNKLLRKDQIDFVEKDSFYNSHLYSLIEFKGVRNTAVFENEYIKGKFGAIPYVGDFNKLINFFEDAEED